jgi:hypothetical protein
MNTKQDDAARQALVVILGCLLVLSITIPLAWRRQQQRREYAALAEQEARRPHFSELDLERLDERNPAPPVIVPVADPSPPPAENAALNIGPLQTDDREEPATPYEAFLSLDAEVIGDARRTERPAGSASDDAEPRYRFAVDPSIDPAPDYPVQRAWPVPETLQARLAALEDDMTSRNWAQRVSGRIDQLVALETIRDSEVPTVLNALQALTGEARVLAPHVTTETGRYRLNNAIYDLARRIDVWRSAYELACSHRSNGQRLVIPVSDGAYVARSDASSPAGMDVSSLLAQLEQYEFTRLPSDGRQIAAAIKTLRCASQPQYRLLGERLETHYRNANLRLAVSGLLVNRMLPKTQAYNQSVNDRILGIPVRGNSTTLTKLYLRLLPDPHRIRVGMEAWGSVHARTTASSGPAQVHNRGRSAFLVRKLILVDHEGMKTKRTVAEARSRSRLVAVETNYDGVPVVGKFVRNLARRQHDEQQTQAMTETEAKIATEAQRYFDAQVKPRLSNAVQSFYRQLWKPLEELDLDPAPIAMSTTERRATARLRVGNDLQLAAHTARPRAPEDSLASMQIHESLVNNAIARLELDGKSMTLHELYLYLAKRLDRPVKEVPETMPENVMVKFANSDAIRVRCDNGHVQLTLAIASVERKKSRWTSLVVRANYEPVVDGLNARLVRTGPIQLAGYRLRTRDQIALRGVFSKVLSKSHEVQLVPDEVIKDERLADLSVTQTKIEEGWIGLAMGPTRKF